MFRTLRALSQPPDKVYNKFVKLGFISLLIQSSDINNNKAQILRCYPNASWLVRHTIFEYSPSPCVAHPVVLASSPSRRWHEATARDWTRTRTEGLGHVGAPPTWTVMIVPLRGNAGEECGQESNGQYLLFTLTNCWPAIPCACSVMPFAHNR